MKTEYAKLPGIGTGRWGFQVGIRHRIYQGTDHFLLVQSTGYTEEYRRVFYRDIRYVMIRKDRRHLWISLICLGLLLFGSLGIFFLPLASSTKGWLVAIWCAPFVLVLLINLLRGPTCGCYLSTNVQTVLLAAPKRMNKVVRLLDFLQGKIADAPATQQVM